jgi:hypothetical protein
MLYKQPVFAEQAYPLQWSQNLLPFLIMSQFFTPHIHILYLLISILHLTLDLTQGSYRSDFLNKSI